ncbi:FAD:protein FMN transferase [Selenomonas ruminantium]|uniref:FAD:protein FMN transferase n=1 Tax=Selenomonas ruminantium TaxID=971 RepID=A0A1H0TSS9_SELRU|nr:FAD:protein FMN transferase [Selenomonas ruminantium]SDP57142.1 thiamine biosynthesis lipoprotein [Selenomonas ruminantium]
MLVKRIVRSCILLLVLCLCAGCGEQSDVKRSDIVLDTAVTLTARGEDAQAAIDESMARIRNIDNMVNPNVPDSDVSKLSQNAGTGKWVPLQPETYKMLAVAQDYARKTNGAFDVTTKPLVDLWGIGTDHAKVPTPAELSEAQKKVGWQKLELNEGTHSARLVQKGMGVDLGGIAKGFAVDEVRKIYARYGIKDGLINLGSSSMYALGVNQEGQPWRIGLRHPRKEDAQEKMAILPLENEALSTSGDYERFFEANGTRYHHILDPRTGWPAMSGAMSVTIVAADRVKDGGMLTDILTTAVFVLGPEQGARFLRGQDGIEGAITDGRYQLWTTGNMATDLLEVSPDFHFWQESGENL